MAQGDLLLLSKVVLAEVYERAITHLQTHSREGETERSLDRGDREGRQRLIPVCALFAARITLPEAVKNKVALVVGQLKLE